MRARFRTASVLVVSALVLAACGGTGGDGTDETGGPATGAQNEFPMTVENCGRQVTFDKRPERVLAINPEAAIMLTEAGADDRISSYAGFVDVPFGDAEPAVSAAQQLGSGSDLSFETIIAARPDVVVDGGVRDYREQLAASGIQTLIVSGYCEEKGFSPEGDPPVFDLIYRDIETYGKLFGTQDTAAKSVTDLRERVTAVEKQVDSISYGRSTAALYMYTGGQPLGAYGNKAVIDDQMRILGLKNVFGDLKERYFEPTVEDIIARNPEQAIALYLPEQSQLPNPQSVIQELHRRKELAGVTAIRDDAVLPLNYYFSGPGPLAVDGLEQLAKQIVERK